MNLGNSQSRVINILWVITGFVMILLLVFTVRLAIKTNQVGAAGFYTSIDSTSPTVSIREEPSWVGRVVAILDNGTQIFVDDETEVGVTVWLHINSGDFSGWVPSRYTSVDSP